jgi:hypothetical protein
MPAGHGRAGLLAKLLVAVRAEFRTEIYRPTPDDPVSASGVPEMSCGALSGGLPVAGPAAAALPRPVQRSWKDPHACRPLSASSVRHLHFILRGAFGLAVRWRWIAVNPAADARPPSLTPPNPTPPSTKQAATLLTAAWERDPD